MSESDSVAVARVLRGEGDAYRMLVEKHGRFLFRVAFRITGNVSDAEDVVQEAFLRAFRSLHLYDSRATFSTWMHRIAANCALDMVRKRNRRMESVVADTGDDDVKRDILAQIPAKDPGTDRVVYSSQVRDHVKLAMEDLSPLERSAFVLRHFEGNSIDEISTTLSVSENAAKQSIFRAVQKLRRTGIRARSRKCVMNHVTQEQLVDHYYGEPQATLEVERHLTECEECRAQFQTLKRVLNSVEGYPVPEPAASYESRLWKKLAPDVSPQQSKADQGRWWITAGAIAAMLVVAFVAGRASRTPAPGVKITTAIAKGGDKGQSVPVLVIAVGDHLERLEAVLTELENADVHRSADLDISYEQRSAEDLLDSNRLYRQTAAAQGDVVTASVLEDFENVLLEITHQPAHVSAQQMEDLRRDIKDRGVLFKAKVLGSRMRGEETKL